MIEPADRTGVAHETIGWCPGGRVAFGLEVDTAAPQPTDSDLDPICVSTAITNGVDPFEFCDLQTDATSNEITPALVAAALTRVALPASTLQVQPPDGRTLVNFDTNFYTDTSRCTHVRAPHLATAAPGRTMAARSACD